jgi:bidirectional [NiFe] hydrogenase diaphorase subunit
MTHVVDFICGLRTYMPSYLAKPTPPNQDKRWKLVDATIRRQGQQQRGLIETLHTVQEAFGYLDVQALRMWLCRCACP